jgi:pyruvate carboxylase
VLCCAAGTGVATQIAAAEAGADIIDACIDSMSGLTSQPNMGAIVNALAGTPLDTGIDPKQLLVLNNYWCVACVGSLNSTGAPEQNTAATPSCAWC